MNWKTISTETELDTKYVTVYKDKVQVNDIEVIDDFYTVKIQDAALIVALTPDGNVILKSEYRYACRAEVIECPAGMVEANEDPMDTAKRELLEETGYAGDKWTYLGPTLESTSKLTNTMHIFLAENCVRVDGQHLDKNEHLEFCLVDLKDAVNMVMNGKINANSSAHAILKVARIAEV